MKKIIFITFYFINSLLFSVEPLPHLAETDNSIPKPGYSATSSALETKESNPLFPKKLMDNKGKSVSSEVLKDKIVGIYFSAQWCPPCRGFTPSLVDFRNKNSDEFEVVFVSSDRSKDDQLKYMEKYNMSFYALPHGSDAANELKKKFEVRGIPSLVIVDADGNTITKNGRGDVSGNPSGAVSDWKKKS